MPRKPSPQKQLELESLHRVATVLAAFIDSRFPTPLPDGGFSGAIQRAFERGDLRGLRMAHNDLVASLEAASAAEKRDIGVLLQERAGVSVTTLLQRRFQMIERILARGRLTSEEQYYLVREYVELAEHDSSKADEVIRLWQMMHTFEERGRAQARSRSNEEL